MLVKSRRNSRYYYNEPYLFIHGPNEKIKLKTNLSDYQKIIAVFRDTLQGVEEEVLYEKYRRYSSLIQLLLEKQVFYKITVEQHDKHKNSSYLPWVEEACLEVQKSLEQVEKISIGIPENFFGKEYLREYFSANNLTTNSSKEESFEIKLNGEIKQQYYIWKKENDVYLSIRKPKRFEPIQKNDISERLIAGFIYYCAIVSTVAAEAPTFKIDHLLEVERKTAFQEIEVKNHPKTNSTSKVSKDPIKNYNSLEYFVKNYDSKIKSFNKNDEYMKYNQSPLQIITVQTEEERNYYFADISYERLSQIVTEVAFIEILKDCYQKDLLLLSNDKLIHGTLHNKCAEQWTFDLALLEEGELLKDLLQQEDLRISCYIQACEEGGCYLSIANHKEQETVEFQLPLKTEAQMTTALLTWISIQMNQISVEETFYAKTEYREEEPKAISSLADMLTHQDQAIKWHEVGAQTNLGEILKRNGFDYELLGVKR
jgi:hypothetical protein